MEKLIRLHFVNTNFMVPFSQQYLQSPFHELLKQRQQFISQRNFVFLAFKFDNHSLDRRIPYILLLP